MKNIAIIPARSGSKGLPDKNIKLLNNKPLIAYTIEAALESKKFEQVVVSTDSEKYAKIAEKFGAHIPYIRSESLSNDTASTWDVVRDVLTYYKNKNIFFDTISLLQPTSPFRKSKDIINAYNDFTEKDADSIISVCEQTQSPLWCNTLPNDKSLTNFISKDVLNLPRQKLSKYYRLNGALYIVKSKIIMDKSDIYNQNSYAYLMSKRNSVDIDDIEDFRIAEYLLNYAD